MKRIVFVELFDMHMQAHCSVNCSNTFMLNVYLLSVPWCSCIVTVKFCSIKSRLERCSSRVYNGNLVYCDRGVSLIFTLLYKLKTFIGS